MSHHFRENPSTQPTLQELLQLLATACVAGIPAGGDAADPFAEFDASAVLDPCPHHHATSALWSERLLAVRA